MIGKTWIIMLVIIAGCNKRSAEEKLKQFVDDSDNKITQQITVGDVGIVTKYLPSSYRELAGNNRVAATEPNDDYYYFICTRLFYSFYISILISIQ